MSTPQTDNADRQFDRRLSEQNSLLQHRLRQLYGHTPGFEPWYAQLLDQLRQLHRERSTALQALDAAREADPGWFQHQTMLGYCSYVDRFGGDLQGVRSRIDYLRELGVRYLHLLPFLRARAGDSDGGFAVASFDEIEPRLGSMEDLEALTADLRAAGISLCSDLVLNHVADDHPWARAAAAGDAHHRAFFHCFADRTEPDAYEQTLVQIFPRTAPGNFTYVEALNAWVWTTFFPYQWDLNYANPAVFAEIAQAMLRLANRGVDVFRLDSAPYIWKRPGTDCRNQPEAHWVLQALRAVAKLVAPGVLLKAEAIVPTPELAPYFGTGDAHGRECDLAYHSSAMAACWAAVAEQRTDLLQSVIASMPPLPARGSWITYIRCHDDIGWNVLRPDAEANGGLQRLSKVARFYSGVDADSFAEGTSFQADDADGIHGSNGMSASLLGRNRARSTLEREQAERRLHLLHGVALTLGGLPLLYMGDELGMTNDDSDDSRAAQKIDGRWLQRPPLDLTRLQQRHDPDTEAGRLYQRLRNMIQLRGHLASLSADAPLTLLPSAQPALLAYQRGGDFVMLANFSSEALQIDLSSLGLDAGATWHDRLANASVSTTSLTLDAWSQRWLQRIG